MPEESHSPDFWVQQWREALAQSVWSQGHGYASRHIWDQMAADYGNGHQRGKPRDQQPKTVIQLLIDRGLLHQDCTVLDVGCGTGRMAIPLAQQGANVVALDFSQGMLNRFRQSVPPALAGRIDIVHADWDSIDLEEHGWKGAFDLAFASMTPAIRTPDSFLKLHQASRAGCYFRGWAGQREDPLLQELWQHILKKPMPTMGWNITLAFNLLRAMGLSAAIEFQTVRWQREEPAEKAAGFFAGFFSGLTEDSPDALRQKILQHLHHVARNGSVCRCTAGQTGSMTWRI